ncbi:MAG: prephenate dehydrogenase/arogenate dehydrogenase family protein, partial [Pirellulaceae bacterium]
FETIAIVGVGLLGGSIGLAVRERHIARRVVGIGRNLAKLREAENRHAVTDVTTDLAAGVREADLVIICTPVETVVDLVRQIAPAVGKGTLISDVGSTKATIVAGADQVLADGKGLWASFVGSHPLAGSEKNGVLFARADLLEGRTVVITPSSETN